MSTRDSRWSRRLRAGLAAGGVAVWAVCGTLGIGSAIAMTEPSAQKAQEAAGERVMHDRWYAVLLAGSRSGWMHDRAVRRGDEIVTMNDTRLEIRRGAASVRVSFETEFVETPDHEPVSVRVVQRMSDQATTTTYTFTPDGVVQRASTGGREPVETKLDRPEGKWLTPAAAEEFVRQRVEGGAREFSVRTLDAASGFRPVLTTFKRVGEANVEVLGREVPGLSWETTVDAFPGMVTEQQTDRSGVPVRTVMNLGAMKFEMVLADRDLAQAEAEPPELLLSMFVKPDRAIDDARSVRRAVYEVRSENAVPSGGAQRVEPAGPGKWRVTVDLDAVPAAPAGEVGDDAYTRASPMLDAQDEEIRRLAERAARGADGDEAAKAEAMRRFVHRHINKKNLGVGLATASETARTRSGDCTEHACLLAAMLRAEGIPSRTVSGLVYVDAFGPDLRDSFGYHMWTQALLEVGGEKRWIDLDAVLSQRHTFDATHIALAHSAMDEGAIANDLMRMAPMLGTLEIRVKEPR